MKTIIQTIGPLYGEVVNGSVFGQPNGSIAVQPGGPTNPNTLTITNKPGYIVGVPTSSGKYTITFCDAEGAVVTTPLTIAATSNVDFRIYVSITIGTEGSGQAWRVNESPATMTKFDVVKNTAPAAGTTYTVKVQLWNADGITMLEDTFDVVGVSE